MVDYDTASVNTHASACDVDEKCDRHHLLSNHLDIEAIINKAFGHFLRDEQKFARIISIVLSLFVFCGKSNKVTKVTIKARTFLRFFQGALGSARFSTLSTINNECNKRKSWLVSFIDHHRFPFRSHDDTKLSSYFGGSKNREMDGWLDIGVEA